MFSYYLPQELLSLIVNLLDTSSQYALCFVSKSFRIKTITPKKYTMLMIIYDAVLHDYESMFKWFVVSNRYSISEIDRYDICKRAAAVGSFGILKYAYQHIYKNKSNKVSNILDESVKNGHFEIVKWSHENGCHWDEQTCSCAARNGHFEILKWLHENGCPWDNNTSANAAECGHFEILRWSRENGCPWNEWACRRAALIGHLEILKWLHENGCPWDSWACQNAAENGHFDVLQYLHENECPCRVDDCAYCG